MSVCDLNVSITSTPDMPQSGFAAKADGGPGFLRDDLTPDGFLQECVSGCANVLVTVKRFDDSTPAANVSVNASVTGLSGKSVVKEQGGGFLCQVASGSDNRDGTCGDPVNDLKTDADGHIYLRYWPPPVWVPPPPDSGSADFPTTEVYAVAHGCGDQSCELGDAKLNVAVHPHIIYGRNGDIGAAEKQLLIDWSDDNYKAIQRKDDALTSKILNGVSGIWKPLRLIAEKDLPFPVDAADLLLLGWFDTKYGVAEDGLTNMTVSVLGSNIASYVANYIKDPAVHGSAPWISKLVTPSGDYANNVLEKIIRPFAIWLSALSEIQGTKHTTLFLYETSYCPGKSPLHPGECRGPASDITATANLFLSFSANGGNDHDGWQSDVDIDYAPSTWIPAQCASKFGCRG